MNTINILGMSPKIMSKGMPLVIVVTIAKINATLNTSLLLVT